MSQHDFVIDNAAGATVRADLNNAIQALASRNSGASAPSTTYANMVWVDTTNHVVKVRNEANTAWIIVGRTDAEGVKAITGATTVALRDFGKLFDATSGTFTLTLPAAATATDGFWFECRNSGTGIVTIDADAAETIDGLTTIEVHPGEFVRVQCNGTLWRSDRIRRMGSLPENIQTDTYTVTTADRGKLLIANKATAMTFDLPAAATAGKGFVLFYKNIGAGTLTIDGNSTETIDGSTTKSVAQNESGVLECDGSNWRSLLTGGSGGGDAPVILSAQSASASATIDFAALFDDATYSRYEVELNSIKPVSDGVAFSMRIGTGAGPTYQTTGYIHAGHFTNNGGEGLQTDVTTEIKLTRGGSAAADLGNASGEKLTGLISFSQPDSSDFCEFTYDLQYSQASGITCHVNGGGRYDTAGAITALRFFCSTGNIASGLLILKGYPRS